MSNFVPIEQCDISDKERLAVFRYFWCRWNEMLNGNDAHAISKQITKLFTADLEFRTINFARGICEAVPLPQNDMVHFFISHGFVAHQSLVIRRLTEEYDGQRSKAVYSIPRIISEMSEQRELLTREMYVCGNGHPYDPEGRSWDSDYLHRSFDELAKVSEVERARTDLIHEDYFKSLRKRFDSSKKIRTYANKFLAHAADPVTRAGGEGFSLFDLENVYRDLAFVANELSAKVLYSSGHIFLPSFIYDPLEYIENPICPAASIDQLRSFWSQRESELRQFERQDVAS